MQILRRNRLGNDTEDITLYSAPRTLAGTVAVIDGYDVLSIQTAPIVSPGPTLQQTTPVTVAQAGAAPAPVSPSKQPTQKLFNVLGLGVFGGPRGIAYVDSKQQFVFNEDFQLSTLFFSDPRGLAIGTVNIQYPNGQPVLVEGLSYIPTTARSFPNTLLMIASFEDDNSDSGLQSRVEVINLDGTVAREIVPPPDIAQLLLTGVAFKAQTKTPESILLSSDDNETIYELGFKGNLIATYQAAPDPRQQTLHGIEGLAPLPTGQVAAAGNFDGLLALVNLAGGPTEFRNYQIGLGLSLPSGVAWDSTNNQFLVISFNRQRPDSPEISSVSPLLNSFQTIVAVDPTTRKLAYIPGERLIAAAHPNNPRGILLFNGAKPAGQIDTSQFGVPSVISFIPSTNEFVISFNNSRTKLTILARQGTLSREIDLAPQGINKIACVAFFNPTHPSGGQFLVIDNSQDLTIVTDFNGNKLDKFNTPKTFNVLNPSAVTAITTGSDAGAFALANSENSELIVFRLD